MNMEKSRIEMMYLSERKCLKVPEFLCIAIDDYAKSVYDLLKAGWNGNIVKYVICCYPRDFLPRYFSDTCVISDIHYIEFLGDLTHWYRLKERQLIESLCCKYVKNMFLSRNDYVNATFYEWLIRNKQLSLPVFTKEDYEEAFLMNKIALLHESAHFLKDYDEFEALFIENEIDKKVNDVKEVMREGKCDFMGLVLLLKIGRDLKISQEQIVEKYFQVIEANCYYSMFDFLSVNNFDTFSQIKSFTGRIYTIVSFLCGLRDLFPKLDMNKVNLDILTEYGNGLYSIREFVGSQLKDYAMEYNKLPKTYKESICVELQKQENELRECKEFVTCPDELFYD